MGAARQPAATMPAMSNPDHDDIAGDAAEAIHEPRLWREKGWTARVVKNNDDEGWAVEMILQGEPEPALVGPWTMGRDKKSPKPLDTNAFNTLVKTAAEVIRRHEQQRVAELHREVLLTAEAIEGNELTGGGALRITLDITPDEDEPHAWLAAFAADGSELARVRVAASFRLDAASARRWVEGGLGRPS